MRRHEIDWIRNISVLMLFIYHTSAIFCIFGDFYIISSEKNIIANMFIVLMFVWYMPMLFFLAGASTYFASKKRQINEYLKERFQKLFIPLLFGIVFLVPPQTYLARIWRGETNLNYFKHLKYYFTNLTDFTGYDGAFSPAHLWFILYLFIVSVIGGLIIFKVLKGNNGEQKINCLKKILLNKFSFLILLVMGILSDVFPSIMGKSIFGCLIIFILGFLVYSDESIINKVIDNKYKFLSMLIISAITGILYVFEFRENLSEISMWFIDSILKNIVLISAISSIIAFSSLRLNKDTKLLKYLNESSFPVYIIHQPILLIVAFFVIPTVKSTTLSMLIIIIISLIVTFATFELLKRFKIFKYALGLK